MYAKAITLLFPVYNLCSVTNQVKQARDTMQATSEGTESRHVGTLAQCAWTEITLALNAGCSERENEIKK